MKHQWVSLIWLCLICSQAFASSKLTNARVWDAPDHTRVVFELSKETTYNVMVLPNPDRVVVDLANVAKQVDLSKVDFSGTEIKSIRSGVRYGNDLRVVLDMNTRATEKHFKLKPNEKYGHRLVVDLYTDQKKRPAPKPIKTVTNNIDKRNIMVVIDPGHGGEDPGALGPSRIKEKVIVLAIAKALEKELLKTPGFDVHLTRRGDYYIGLRRRTEIAREKNADLLVSVHADAFKKPQANGVSVFALSTRGASSEQARWLAQKENASDLIGGVSLGGKDDVLASVLLDLSSTASLKASLGVGDKVLRSMDSVAKLHQPRVQQAGFAVLKAPDVPSILVETGFISNPAESRRLNTKKYQRQIASAIHRGIEQYFVNSPPSGTLLAWRKKNPGQIEITSTRQYVVKKGDTLSHIAARNDLSVKSLRKHNKLKSDTVWIGQRLQIPSS